MRVATATFLTITRCWARWPITAGPPKRTRYWSGSPAINRGSPAETAPNDGRGEPFLRIVGGRADIGPYELQSVAGLNLNVDTNIDENDGDYSEGDLSLREAIGLANGSTGAEHHHVRRSAFRRHDHRSAAATWRSPKHSRLTPGHFRKP